MNTFQLVQLLISFVNILSNIIVYAIIGRVLFSWFKTAGPYSSMGRFEQLLHDVTDPFINLARKIPHRAGFFDFSPIIALIGIDLLSQLVIILLSKLVA